MGDADAKYIAKMEERKRKRKISNRESARRSRLKRKQQTNDMTSETAFLQYKRLVLIQRFNMLMQSNLAVENYNRALRAQKKELLKKLESAQRLIRYLKSIETSQYINHQMEDDGNSYWIDENWQLHPTMQLPPPPQSPLLPPLPPQSTFSGADFNNF